MRLKTGIILMAAMGCRAIEACAVRNCDIDFERGQITFRKEYSKMRVERARLMTVELVRQLQVWLKWKYDTHPWVHVDGKREIITPKVHPDDLLLATWGSILQGPCLMESTILSITSLETWERGKNWDTRTAVML